MLDVEAIPRLDILTKCRHYAQFRCCDGCPNGYDGLLDDCPTVTDWKAALLPSNVEHRTLNIERRPKGGQ